MTTGTTVSTPRNTGKSLRQREEAPRYGTAAKDLAFMPHAFVNFSLPQRAITDTMWRRKNGKDTLTMTAGVVETPQGPVYMLPYGRYARALILYLCTQARKTSCATIPVAHSYRGLMEQIGMPWNKNNATEAIRQLQALLASSISITRTRETENGRTVDDVRFTLAFSSHLTFELDREELKEGEESTVTLSETFFQALMDGQAIPVKYEAWLHLARLTKSPLPLDLYVWLSYRMNTVKSEQRVTWVQLYEQFGATGSMRAFRGSFRAALELVRQVYPEANITEVGAGGGTRKGLKGFLLRMSKNALDTAWTPEQPQTALDSDGDTGQ